MKTADLLAKGEDALQAAQDLLAKAQGGGLEDDLEDDFAEYDDTVAPEEEAPEATPSDAPPTDNAPDAPPVDDEEDEEEDADDIEEDEEEPAPLTKAQSAEPIDATPLLEEIDRKLAVAAKLEETLSQILAKAEAVADYSQNYGQKLDSFLGIAKAQQASLEHFAKAQSSMAGLPRIPKAQRQVKVPTQTKQTAKPIGELFAKAYEVADAVQVGKLEHYFNRGDADGLIATLTPQQRAQVLKD